MFKQNLINDAKTYNFGDIIISIALYSVSPMWNYISDE